jgi:hypothetical protein
VHPPREALGMLISYVKDDIILYIAESLDLELVWKSLQGLYESLNSARKQLLVNELSVKVEGVTPISEFLKKMLRENLNQLQCQKRLFQIREE